MAAASPGQLFHQPTEGEVGLPLEDASVAEAGHLKFQASYAS
jgi:hypothetical protein